MTCSPTVASKSRGVAIQRKSRPSSRASPRQYHRLATPSAMNNATPVRKRNTMPHKAQVTGIGPEPPQLAGHSHAIPIIRELAGTVRANLSDEPEDIAADTKGAIAGGLYLLHRASRQESRQCGSHPHRQALPILSSDPVGGPLRRRRPRLQRLCRGYSRGPRRGRPEDRQPGEPGRPAAGRRRHVARSST